MAQADLIMLRDLAKRYLDVCADPNQQRLRQAWRRHNSLKPERPLIYVRAYAWEEYPNAQPAAADPFWHGYEGFFRRQLFRASLRDDSIFEPWLTVPAVLVTPPHGPWGLPCRWITGNDPRGAKAMNPPLREPEDIARLANPHHQIDQAASRERRDRVREALGDVIDVALDRAPLYRVWNGDISTQLGHLRGIEQVMIDMMDRPDWLHELLAHMRDGILRTHDEAEAAGDWRLLDHENQAMPYAEELADPTPHDTPVKRRDLWHYCASQELTLVGPAQFDEFMLQYQLPIMARFGLVAYGCCEDLTRKIDVLRQIPRLRRIAVSPMANVARCAEQIGRDYVVSYRPSPTDMVGYGWDEDRIRRILRQDLRACRDCHVDITLKDVMTVENDHARLGKWVTITRQVIDELWS